MGNPETKPLGRWNLDYCTKFQQRPLRSLWIDNTASKNKKLLTQLTKLISLFSKKRKREKQDKYILTYKLYEYRFLGQSIM
jgi:hypothetical protein